MNLRPKKSLEINLKGLLVKTNKAGLSQFFFAFLISNNYLLKNDKQLEYQL